VHVCSTAFYNKLHKKKKYAPGADKKPVNAIGRIAQKNGCPAKSPAFAPIGQNNP
jgi:hypothetical protein